MTDMTSKPDQRQIRRCLFFFCLDVVHMFSSIPQILWNNTVADDKFATLPGGGWIRSLPPRPPARFPILRKIVRGETFNRALVSLLYLERLMRGSKFCETAPSGGNGGRPHVVLFGPNVISLLVKH